MKKLLTLTLVLCSVIGFAQMRGGAQYDPGAARSNLSNVDATATPSMTSITLSDKIRAAWADILGDIYASGTVKVSTGTAAAPAYSFASDPNTGIYSPAADNLGVSVAGAEALRVNSAGEVLIATSTDAGDYKLQVNGSAYVNGSLLSKSHYVFANNATSTSIPISGYVVASFTAEVVDLEGLFADSTFTAPSPGMYLVTCGIEISDPLAVDRGIAMRFYINGGAFDPVIGYCLKEGTNTLVRRTISAPVYLNTGWQLTVRYAAVGVAVTTTNSSVNNWIRICKIGGGIN